MNETRIIVLVDEESEGYDDEESAIFGDSKVTTIPIGESGATVRGYSADLVLVPETIERGILNRIVRPMAHKGEIMFY